MRHTRALAALSAVIVATTAAFGGPAGAADAPDSEPGEAAIQRGIRLRKAGDDAGALPEFQNAYRLSHTPRAAAQLGLVEQALGHWDDAEVHLTEAVRTAGDAWVEKNRPALQKSLAVAKDHVGTLQVTGEPEGADVYVNGRRRDQIPMSKPISVMAGDVDIEVRANGYKRVAQKVKIAAYEFRPLVIRLERLDAVAAARPGDAVRIAPTDSTRSLPPDTIVTHPATSVAAPAPTDAPVAAPEGHGSPWPIVGWSLAGAGAVAAAVGIVEAVSGQSKINAASGDADRANATADPILYMSAAAKFSDGSSQRSTGRVLMIAGGAVVAAGVVLALTTGHANDGGGAVARVYPSLDLAPGQPSSAGLTMTGTW